MGSVVAGREGAGQKEEQEAGIGPESVHAVFVSINIGFQFNHCKRNKHNEIQYKYIKCFDMACNIDSNGSDSPRVPPPPRTDYQFSW